MELISIIIFGIALHGTIARPDGQSLDGLLENFNNHGQQPTQQTIPNQPSEPREPEQLPHTPSGGQGVAEYNPLECQCVPYYLCQNNSIITDGVGLIDIRIKDGPCDQYLDVCCQKPDTVKEPITPKPHVRSGCGYRNPEGVGFRITGHSDNEAQFGEFPWMVAILREETVDDSPQKLNVYQCGGSLIHPQAVLTAAHCVTGKTPDQLKVRAGEWDTQTKNELFPHQDRLVRKIIVHEDFYGGALYNDVALLILSEPVELTENVDVVCLPLQDENVDNVRCYASGWGKDVFGKEGRYQVILKKIDLPVVPRDQCQDALRKTRLGPYFNLHESFICAGGEEGKDTCKGDGGSPLVCPIRNNANQYIQAGSVAWGIGCGEDGTPGVYVNIAHFRNWIDEQMLYFNLDINTYQY